MFVGHSDGVPRLNAAEVAEWRCATTEALAPEIETQPDVFTPWLELEWRRLRDEYSAAL